MATESKVKEGRLNHLLYLIYWQMKNNKKKDKITVKMLNIRPVKQAEGGWNHCDTVCVGVPL